MSERYKLIGCEILFREICLCAANSKNIIDLEFIKKGLHDMGVKIMSESLQKMIDNVDASRYGAILLCYGLCNNGVSGLRARVPIVIPRAHDCITLFLGSKERYTDYFYNNPGTYFHTSGWLERNASGLEGEKNVLTQLGFQIDADYSNYAEQYGEENAKYLMEMLGDWTRNYKKYAYIDTGVGESAVYEAMSREKALSQNWEHESVKGDIRLIRDLLDGNWNDEDFLVIPPGNTIAASNDESVMASVPIVT